MSDLAEFLEFLLARIAEDEAVAHRIHRDYQHVLGIPHYFEPAHLGGMVGMTPRSALAECEAKRRIIERYQDSWYVRGGATLDMLGWAEEQTGFGRALEWALKSLALPYADHPDYRDEWRP